MSTVWATFSGGESSRFGSPKQWAVVDGVSFLHGAAIRMNEAAVAGDHTVICIADKTDVTPPAVGELSKWHVESESSVLLDDPTCKGPVAGLLAAVRHALLIGAEALVFQPVDMPFLTSQALVELRTRAIQNNAIAIACGPAVGDKAVGDKVWTLGAIPASMLLQVEQRIVGLIGHNEGTTRSSPGLRNVFSDLNVVAVSFSDHILRNVNTPSDLASHDEEHI